MEITVGGHYHVRRRVGAGSFGEVFAGEDVQTHEEVAIKLEPVKTRAPQLLYESKLYLLFAGGVCVPRLHWFGTESNYHVMVIDYLGKSLEDLFQQCNQRFSLKTVLMIADQTICALQYIHNKSFIHRDIKPDNFLIGTNAKQNQIFVIDFGLSKKYRDPHTHNHIHQATGKSLTGTARYASVSALKGLEQSRRDDLESLGYCFLYFLRGSLPWMGLDAKDRKQKYERICEVKNATTFEELCEGYPHEFVEYFVEVRKLGFEEEPNYGYLREIFRKLFINQGFIYDYDYDWVAQRKRNRAVNNIVQGTGAPIAEGQRTMGSNAAHASTRTPEPYTVDQESGSHQEIHIIAAQHLDAEPDNPNAAPEQTTAFEVNQQRRNPTKIVSQTSNTKATTSGRQIGSRPMQRSSSGAKRPSPSYSRNIPKPKSNRVPK